VGRHLHAEHRAWPAASYGISAELSPGRARPRRLLVILTLVSLVIIDAADLSGLSATLARNTIPLAAILFPAGFFFSSLGRGVTEPNRFILLLYAGAISLAVGVVSLGVGLLAS
jgi:hypothetical protein